MIPEWGLWGELSGLASPLKPIVALLKAGIRRPHASRPVLWNSEFPVQYSKIPDFLVSIGQSDAPGNVALVDVEILSEIRTILIKTSINSPKIHGEKKIMSTVF